MSRQAITAVVAALGLVLIVGAGVGAAEVERFEAGNIVMEDHGGISPRTLPKDHPAPITASLNARIGTKDGTHPPAAQSFTIDFDKTIHIDTKGLPVCPKGQLESRSTRTVKRVCGNAIVGEGVAEVEVEFNEQPPFSARGPLLAFNGGTHGGKTLLFVHTYLAVPVPTAVVVETKLEPIDRGHYGLHSVTTIPPVAGGAASATAFRLQLGRTFTYKGSKRSYLSASCPTGSYFVKGHADYSDGTRVHITHVLPCTPTG